MANDKAAAIAADKYMDTPLSKISAAQFMDALNANQLVPHVKFWPEKKKYELEVEPVFDKLRLRDFIEIINRIRGEKKKVEYEIPDWWKWRVNPDPTQVELGQRLDDVVQRLDRIASELGRR
jgi:hypothetical protein